MRKSAAVLVSLSLGVAALSLAYGQGKTKIVIESWRNDDLKIWNEKIIPAFNKQYPNIEVVFAPSAPTEYNAALDAKLQAGSGGDLITCRPFDQSLGLFQKKQLDDLSSLKGMGNFSPVAKSALQTDDGKSTFCVPIASVIHGFIYNKKIFSELKLTPPKTEAEFYKLLETVKKSGKYAPLVMGTKDQWESATMGYQNIGPNYWGGESGRKALIAGTAKRLTDVLPSNSSLECLPSRSSAVLIISRSRRSMVSVPICALTQKPSAARIFCRIAGVPASSRASMSDVKS